MNILFISAVAALQIAQQPNAMPLDPPAKIEYADKSSIQLYNEVKAEQARRAQQEKERAEKEAEAKRQAEINAQRLAGAVEVTPTYENTVQSQPQQQEQPEQETGTIQTHNGYSVNSKKEAIAMSESGGDYNAVNGRYRGKYQLDSAYLNGDYSPENQERVFEQYVNERYGGIDGAWAHWQANGWY